MGLNCVLLPFFGWGRAQILIQVEHRVRERRRQRERECVDGRRVKGEGEERENREGREVLRG